MRRRTLWALVAALLLAALLPGGALAAGARNNKPSIKLGGKVGFMYVGGEVTLTPSLKNVDRASLTWSSTDESVIGVSGGAIQAKSAGRAVITVSGGGATARCGVVALPREISLKVGETVNLPYGTVETYRVRDAAIAAISKSGAITGLSGGVTYIQVRYGRQKLILQVTVVDENSVAATLDAASQTNQIVLVEYTGGSSARLSIHENQLGTWRQLYVCDAVVGQNGIDKAMEGDKRTPTGTFNLTQPFGIKADPGANMAYTKVTKYHYWCGSSNSDYYNRLVDTRVVSRARTSSDEYLLGIKGYYNYCMFIDYNAEGVSGKGSCIFLHCKGRKNYTSGCVAVDEAVMKRIIQWARPGAKIVIRAAQD